jgi:NADPH-dependent 2,4-dienoyl-CoA reductase/sulfur reductase-like enzyme
MNSAPSAPAPRRILIVGGVAGGASAATRARRTNEHAEIVVFEKDAYVSFANCGLPYHIGGTIAERDKLIVATPERFRERFRIDVRTRHEVLAIDRARKRVRVRDHAAARDYEAAYDKLILAPGASPIVPDVPGVKSRGVFTLRNLDDMDRIVAAVPQARTVAVVGAGFIGLEVAEQLRERGLAVTLIEKAGQVLPLLDPELAEPLRRELLRAGVEVIVGTGFQAIDAADGIATGVVLEDGRRIPADLVVLGLGVRPNVKLAVDAGLELGKSGGIDTDAYQRTSDPDIYAVGDAAEYTLGAGGRGRVPLAGIANRTGRLAGQHAATDASAQAPGAWGTAIVKVFGLTAGITGDSLRAARRRGLDARAVHVTGNHHAGYYPGASPLTLALVYEVPSGRILGAEAIGAAGVDKRLDVIATLLHSRGSVHDLAQLDLAYAPPFGAAKDPLHIAAFAAENDLDGLAPLVAPGDDLGGSQVVDVREPAERESPLCTPSRSTGSARASANSTRPSPWWCRARPACAPTSPRATCGSSVSMRAICPEARWSAITHCSGRAASRRRPRRRRRDRPAGPRAVRERAPAPHRSPRAAPCQTLSPAATERPSSRRTRWRPPRRTARCCSMCGRRRSSVRATCRAPSTCRSIGSMRPRFAPCSQPEPSRRCCCSAPAAAGHAAQRAGSLAVDCGARWCAVACKAAARPGCP